MRFVFLALLFNVSFLSCAFSIGVLGEFTRKFIVIPGETIQGDIAIENLSKNEPKTVKIYQTDIEENSNGEAHYKIPAGETLRSNAKWIKLSHEIITLPPGGKGMLSFHGVVPSNVEGSFFHMIMIEKLSKDSAEVAGANRKKGFGIVVKTRYAVRILTTIKGTGKKKIKFLQRKITETKNFEVDVENSGSLAFESKFWVELFDQAGKPVGKFAENSIRKNYPGSSLRHRVSLSSLNPGKYTALCAIDAGDDDLFGARYQIEIK